MTAAAQIIEMLIGMMGLNKNSPFQQVLEELVNAAQSKDIFTDHERIQMQAKIQTALSEAGLLKGHDL
ncbi:hypothetical protein [Deinococcus misasensis]|uniref:hypothetical protein n=1 Tax=Deinococcus misasensis TaxID=392413 RepID=UPI0005554A03|nr:hypothetical protein [Deinococcus misasensis]